MKPAVVAVLDVGKTNKKLSLYDRGFQSLEEDRIVLETAERDGLEVERSQDLLEWLRGALGRLSGGFDIRAISITTHGATCALLDDAGHLPYPIISYTSPKGDEIQEEFYSTFGDAKTLHRQTATPDLGFVNVGKVLFYVKTRMPEVWRRSRHALFYPQYLGFELTGRHGLEPTYLGNHSYLWNFEEQTWSTVARGLGADKMFPGDMRAPWSELGLISNEWAQMCGLSPDCKVTLGIHDSNANLLDYLAQGFANFTLNSTGTWCVGMRRSESSALTEEEVNQKVFFNLDVFNRPVKTSIFMAGLEYERYTSFTAEKDAGDLQALERVLEARQLFIIPGVMPGTGMYPDATPRVVSGKNVHTLKDLQASGEKPMTSLGQDYLAALDLSLALQTREMLRRCGTQPGEMVLIEGGFAKNKLYCGLVAALCPDNEIALTNLKEGTSMGAAMIGWMMLENLDVASIGKEYRIETQPVAPLSTAGIDEYHAEFMRHVRS